MGLAFAGAVMRSVGSSCSWRHGADMSASTHQDQENSTRLWLSPRKNPSGSQFVLVLESLHGIGEDQIEAISFSQNRSATGHLEVESEALPPEEDPRAIRVLQP